MIFSLPSGDNSRGFLSWFFTAGSCCLCLLLSCLSHKSSGAPRTRIQEKVHVKSCKVARGSLSTISQAHLTGERRREMLLKQQGPYAKAFVPGKWSCKVQSRWYVALWHPRKLVNPRGNQPWIFIRRTVTEAEAPILWPPDAKSQLIGKDPDAGKDWGQEEKVTANKRVR